eukprot:m.71032 g.71032  ORF g.71032 m.71032 type:complete len:382 (-) comp10046_c0_seq4:16-1161(-)
MAPHPSTCTSSPLRSGSRPSPGLVTASSGSGSNSWSARSSTQTTGCLRHLRTRRRTNRTQTRRSTPITSRTSSLQGALSAWQCSTDTPSRFTSRGPSTSTCSGNPPRCRTPPPSTQSTCSRSTGSWRTTSRTRGWTSTSRRSTSPSGGLSTWSSSLAAPISPSPTRTSTGTCSCWWRRSWTRGSGSRLRRSAKGCGRSFHGPSSLSLTSLNSSSSSPGSRLSTWPTGAPTASTLGTPRTHRRCSSSGRCSRSLSSPSVPWFSSSPRGPPGCRSGDLGIWEATPHGRSPSRTTMIPTTSLRRRPASTSSGCRSTPVRRRSGTSCSSRCKRPPKALLSRDRPLLSTTTFNFSVPDTLLLNQRSTPPFTTAAHGAIDFKNLEVK